jgi:adenylyl- and sulfurtransferase ThiI
LNVVIAFPSAFTDVRALARTIQKATTETIRSVAVEHNCIICESSDIVELAYQLASIFGVESVAVAKKVSSNFSDLTAAIVDVGISVIVPGDRFHVRVMLQPTAKCDYVSRDIEFAVSGTLAARLTSINARPAKTEVDASRQILSIVGKESAYVCVQVMTAPSGLIAGSHGGVLSSIHDSLSFLASLMAAKAGFDCSTIVLPYLKKTNDLGNANQCPWRGRSISLAQGEDHIKSSNSISEQQDRFSLHHRFSSDLVHRNYISRNSGCRKDAFCASGILIK